MAPRETEPKPNARKGAAGTESASPNGDGPPLDPAQFERMRKAREEKQFEPTRGENPKTGKPTFDLAAKPEMDDHAGMCSWLTLSLNLDPAHPVTGGKRLGLHDPTGSAVLEREGAPALSFAPIGRLLIPIKLRETVTTSGIPSDGGPSALLTGGHCNEISIVVCRLCVTSHETTSAERLGGIIRTLLSDADQIPGPVTTYGTTSKDRYWLAMALTPVERERWRYAVDSQTGELIVRVSDATWAARKLEGSGWRRGELDALVGEVGWRRIVIDGHEGSGQAGHRGRHKRVFAYRGVLATDDEPDPVPAETESEGSR